MAQGTPTAAIIGRCGAPSMVGDLFPGKTPNRVYVVRAVRRIENSSNILVGWEYVAGQNVRFIQPMPDMNQKDGAFLHVTVPKGGVGWIYPLRRLPRDVHVVDCR
jgi:hypothetical protein